MFLVAAMARNHIFERIKIYRQVHTTPPFTTRQVFTIPGHPCEHKLTQNPPFPCNLVTYGLEIHTLHTRRRTTFPPQKKRETFVKVYSCLLKGRWDKKEIGGTLGLSQLITVFLCECLWIRWCLSVEIVSCVQTYLTFMFI